MTNHIAISNGGDGAAAKGMGWRPDYPDFRDYRRDASDVQPLLVLTDASQPRAEAELPPQVDLRSWCSDVEDQGTLGSCTAQAGAGMVEYFERRAFGKHIDASRRFLYKVTRRLGHFSGDSGAFLRTTMGAMVLFGVPPEEFWPYEIEQFDEEPPAFCYAFAANYQTVTYYRLDPPETRGDDLLADIKTHLVSQLPTMFGFTVFNSISQANETGEIPFPTDADHIAGGHAVVAVGYDDKKKVENRDNGGSTTEGAFLIRNSWSRAWGEEGYGWLPYEYVRNGLAEDWWILLKHEWVDTGAFTRVDKAEAARARSKASPRREPVAVGS